MDDYIYIPFKLTKTIWKDSNMTVLRVKNKPRNEEWLFLADSTS